MPPRRGGRRRGGPPPSRKIRLPTTRAPPPPEPEESSPSTPPQPLSEPSSHHTPTPDPDPEPEPEHEPEPVIEPEPEAEPQTSPVRKRRGPGRPRKEPPDHLEAGAGEDTSDATQVRKPRTGRGIGLRPGGGRWANRRSGPHHVTQMPMDKEGNAMDVADDEIIQPEDPEGETKVDKKGNLQDGREYRTRTFTIIGRNERLYMLSTEPARCVGFRDSYLFFQKHRALFKIIIGAEEKDDLIERNILPTSYRGRAIGVVNARAVFREFGAQIVVGGKKIIDDYKVAEAKAQGDVEGELADPLDVLPPPGIPYNRNQYVAWFGASSVYHTPGPAIPIIKTEAPPERRRKVKITDPNWMLEHCRAASRYNSGLNAARMENQEGLYDIQTNLMFFPANMQPTHARWEWSKEYHVSDEEDEPQSRNINLTNGVTHKSEDEAARAARPPLFTPIEERYISKLAIVDTRMQAPLFSGLPTPGPEGDEHPGHEFVPSTRLMDVPDEVRELLPLDCLQAFDERVEQEQAWVGRWGNEVHDGHRAKIRKVLDVGGDRL